VSTENVLVVVLVINAVLFVVEAGAGLLAHSTALLADSLDMLGDSLVTALVFIFRSDDLAGPFNRRLIENHPYIVKIRPYHRRGRTAGATKVILLRETALV